MKKCRFVGFRLSTESTFPRAILIAELAELASFEWKYKTRAQYWTFEVIGDYICGRIVTLRANQPRVLVDADLATILDHVPTGMNQVSYNFFILHKNTLHGLYAYYSSAVPFADFGDRLERLCKKCIKEDRQATYKKARKESKKSRIRDLDKSVVTKLETKYSLLFMALIRRETMDKVIAKWQQVSAFKYMVSTTQVDADKLGALAPHTKARLEELRLEPSVKAKTYGEIITSFMTDLKKRFGDALKRTSLVGISESGRKRTIDLGKIIDEFADIDLQDVYQDVSAKHLALKTCATIAAMLAEADDRPDYFSKVSP